MTEIPETQDDLADRLEAEATKHARLRWKPETVALLREAASRLRSSPRQARVDPKWLDDKITEADDRVNDYPDSKDSYYWSGRRSAFREVAARASSSPPEREGTGVDSDYVNCPTCGVGASREQWIKFADSLREPASPTSREQEGARVDAVEWIVRKTLDFAEARIERGEIKSDGGEVRRFAADLAPTQED